MFLEFCFIFFSPKLNMKLLLLSIYKLALFVFFKLFLILDFTDIFKPNKSDIHSSLLDIFLSSICEKFLTFVEIDNLVLLSPS